MDNAVRTCFKCWFIIFFIRLLNARAVIDQVDDTDLVHLLTGKDNLIVLFIKNNCQKCDELEIILENIQNELKESIGAVVVKAQNSHMVNLYGPSKEPALIYFRRGTPLLYDGEPIGEEITQLFSENQEPIVKELSDGNFEHLTQASTGASTGDWFIFFYSADCVSCLRLHASWEAVGARLKHRLNVARIDRLGAGISTAKRFDISESPEFIFLRQGKVYRYKTKEYTPNKLIEFVQNSYLKQTNPESVPPEFLSINNFYTKYIESVANSPQFVLVASIALTLIIFIGIFVKCISFKKMTYKETDVSKKAK